MKIIFLDIDGVLNCWSCLSAYIEENHDNDCIATEHVAHLNAIVKRTGAKVVISSTWRILMHMEDIKEHLDWAGFQGEVIGKTPRLGRDRGHEIQAWLDFHSDKPTRFQRLVRAVKRFFGWDDDTIESFVILDDDSDMVHLKPYLVKTSMENGLLEEHVEKAVKVLG